MNEELRLFAQSMLEMCEQPGCDDWSRCQRCALAEAVVKQGGEAK